MEMGLLGNVVDYRIHFGTSELYHAGGRSSSLVSIIYTPNVF